MSTAVDVRPELQDLPQGWFNHGPEVLRLLEQHRPQVVVELGTWQGQSAIPMARSVSRWGGVVYCVDTWAGQLNDDGGSPEGEIPLMLLTFGRHIVQAGVSASIRMICATTAQAAATWTLPIDLLYVDADHSYTGCLADLESWLPNVRRNGLILGDDYGHPRYPGVERAWKTFAKRAGLTLTHYQSNPPVKGGIQLVYGVKP